MNHGRKRPTILVLLFFFLGAAAVLFFREPLPAEGETLEDLYRDWSELAGIDPNAGLTSFLTLIIPPGGQYEGMGTAYTAAAMDSGYIEANPAASSILDQTELSLYHNNWIGNSNVESAVYTIRKDQLGYGFAVKLLYIPFTGLNDWGERYQRDGYKQYATGYYTETVGTLNIAYNFFPNYYFHGVALGVNLKAAYRSVPDAIYQGQSAVAAMADIGLLTKFNLLKFYYSRERNFSLGASAINLGFSRLLNNKEGADDPLPAELAAGIGWSPLRPFTLAFDYNFPLNLEDPSLSQESYMALGTHLQVTDFLNLHSGIILKTGAPRITIGTGIDFENSSIVINYSLDLTTQFERFDRISLEAKIDLGDLGRMDDQERTQDLYLKGLEEYAQGNYQRAIRYWKDALEIDPTFQPAREMLDTTEKSLELQRQMEENQKVE